MKIHFFILALLITALFQAPSLSWGQISVSHAAAAGDLVPAQAPKDQTAGTMFHTLFDGPPQLASGPLDPHAYVTVDVQHLKNPSVAYVNWRALGKILRRLGFKNPPTHLTPELEKIILDMAGNAMMLKDEVPSDYLPQVRQLYAARYGGGFVNGNFGDGRGASGGYVQIKGIGRTPLVRPWANGSHSSGVMGLPESIHEALWANIFEEELPLGANPVLFIIATGTKVEPSHPETSDDRVLVVREDMNRPGYYERSTAVYSDQMTGTVRDEHILADQKRMEALIPKIAQALPLPQNLPPHATASDYLRAALNQFVDNVALQYAAAYARQVYHGATSTSNILTDGRFLDFGTSTAVRGYGKILVLPDDGPNGETAHIKTDLIFEFFQDLRNELPEHLKSSVPTDDASGVLLDELFTKYVSEQFLILAGTPKELAKEALTKPEGRDFAQAVIKIAQDGNDKVLDWAQGKNETVTGTYKLSQVLTSLVNHSVKPPPPMKQSDWDEFNLKSEKYFGMLKSIASKYGIAPRTLRRAMVLGVAARNSTLEEMREQRPMWENFKVQSRLFSSGQNKFAVQNLIDATTERSIHEFKTDPFKIEVAESRNTQDGRVEHRILDLRTGLEQTLQTELPGVRGSREYSKGKGPPALNSALNFSWPCIQLLLF